MTYLRMLTTAVALSLFAIGAHAADNCDRPSPPEIPAANVSEEVLVEAQQEVQAFVSEGQEYLVCLQEAESKMAADATEETRQELVSLFNSMIDEMQEAADSFNETVQEWQEQQDS